MPISAQMLVLKFLKLARGPPNISACSDLFFGNCRAIHSGNSVPRLTRFSLHVPKHVEVEFEDGSTFRLSAEFLRVNSPAADGKLRSIAGEKVIFGRRHVGIMKVEPIGNYGMRIVFDDLHRTGIYTWDYLHRLGTNKFSLMRSYISTLKKHGLSRDPSKRK
ncbi:hypothetical protein MLD38_033660 [Melastoma candidum]|uniref:Uncharacterized protein n=1 Tax=Melastoma candidum TaxID=119954 RepID=A0ACB9M7Y8_9MYRT|nr:hypothetical protein MLD38_033660 [Melastoma candidum]